MNNDPRSLTRRPSRSVGVLLLALVLVAAGGVGAWVTVSRLATGNWPPQVRSLIDEVGATSVGAPASIVVGVILALIALVLLLAALLPGTPYYVSVLSDAVPGQSVLSRRDLALLLQRRVEQVDGVDTVRVRASRSRAKVTVTTLLRDNDAVRAAVQRAAEETVDQYRPSLPMRTDVHIRRVS